jgi:hypothetical protein
MMDLQRLGFGVMDWIEMVQDMDRWRALVIAVMDFRFPCIAGNFLTSIIPVSFFRRTLLHAVNYRVNYIRHYNDFRKACISFVMSVRPYISNNSSPIRWINL